MPAREWFLLSCGLAAVLGLINNLSIIDARDPAWRTVGFILLAVAVVSGGLWLRRRGTQGQ
ncbi:MULTISPECIES: hypothetical protein [Aeromicrobium]|uniref:Uncharacterized protein n=1 Tax=Aeromicrobium yanjiei TaxID=2662028 RepID=A0A5Q2MPH8_9ACTN|nr:MULTISPECIES: hypothetical protein [Aeromicrobium]MRK00665.1 hypothetical protein [Aeromicrobium sp. S22]QGG42505.1 hypothetical protein GEV26_14600 [Aeromicrobium yanjiei]